MADDKEKIKKSLKYSILDGTFYSMMVGFGESFFSAFAVFLRASNIQLGLLGSLPQAVSSFLQLFSNKLIALFGSRKRFVVAFAFLQSLMYIPIALVFFFGEFRVFHLILFISLYWIFGAVLGPAWTSWMGDLVDEDKRGHYFGVRNKVTGFASFVSLLLAGFILQRFSDGTAYQYIGFLTLFSFAFLFRVISVIYLTKKFEPEYRLDMSAQFSFVDFVRRSLLTNFGLFVLFMCFMDFSVYMSAPFFTPYMLRDLRFSYLIFTLITAAAMITKYISMPVWGKATDRFGTRKILVLSSFLMPIVPLLWVFSHNIYYLVLIQAYSGFVWAGFEISSFNYIFNTTTPQKRTTCVSYLNVLRGVAIFLGASIGSLIVRHNSIFWSQYIFIFIVSCFLRYIASFIFVGRLKEFKKKEDIPYDKLFFNIINTMPTMGLIHNIMAFRNRKK